MNRTFISIKYLVTTTCLRVKRSHLLVTLLGLSLLCVQFANHSQEVPWPLPSQLILILFHKLAVKVNRFKFHICSLIERKYVRMWFLLIISKVINTPT
jgi:hypothetical protein